MEFDIVDIDLGRQGQVIEHREDIALIDADTLVYASCVVNEVQNELFSENFYTSEEWKDLLSDPGYCKEDHTIYSIDLDTTMIHCKDKIQGILDETGCTDYELHFTAGRTSFRYTKVNPEYKANRTDRTPIGIFDIKKMFVEAEPDKAFIWYEWEADDIVVAKKAQWPDKYLLVALDKDVLYSLEGTHFNYYSSTLYNKEMHFFEVTAEQALKHHYLQTLTGDAGDGVIGLKGIGPKKAEKILANCTTHQECWKDVVRAYEEIKVLKNGNPATEIDAILNMRLVNMNQLVLNDKQEWEVKLWKPM